MKRFAAATVLVAVAPTVAFALRSVQRPDPNTQAHADGCRRSNSGIFQHVAPNWVYVDDAGAPASGPPPPSRWASGVASAKHRPYAGAYPTGVDDSLTHTSYDFVMNIRVDPQYAGLLGTGNAADSSDEQDRLHVEWEQDALPFFAWPENGDRVLVRGSWVWDCDHYKGGGERTELHPLRAVWDVRAGLSPRSPRAEREGDLVVSTDGTPAYRQAQCAHVTKGDETAFRGCVNAIHPDRQDVNGSYRFFLPAPPRPSPDARMTFRVVDRGSRNAPRLRVARHAGGVEVRFRIAAPAGRRVVGAKQVFAGWSRPGARMVHLRVRFESLLVRRALDPTSRRVGQVTMPPGEWVVYTDVHGIWGMWRPAVLLVDDGDVVRGRQAVDFYVPAGGRWRLAIWTRECDLGAVGNAYYRPNGLVHPCPHTNELGAPEGDDVPGTAIARLGTGGSSLGRHTVDARLEGSTCPLDVRRGCYSLTYRVSRLSG